MARRKPLIPPGSVLPEADMVSRIVERDREKAGRKAPGPAEPGNTTEKNRARDAVSPESLPAYQLTGKLVSQSASKQVSLPVSQEANRETQEDKQDEVEMFVKMLTRTPMKTVSLKMPSGLNDWLDDYVYAHRKDGILKQDLVAEAVRLLVFAKEREIDAKRAEGGS